MQVPPEIEWENFKRREPSLLKPDYKPLDPKNASFPDSDHKLTKPLFEGPLSRKSTILNRRTTSFYVLSRAGFLLEYPYRDPATNPEPTLCLKICDCELGNSPERSGEAEFTIRGKDDGKYFGAVTHEYVFSSDGIEQATQWWANLERFVGLARRSPNADAVTSYTAEGDSSVSAKQYDSVAVPGRVAGTAEKT